MMRLGLPRLFGFPWEAAGNEPASGELRPFVVVGSPLTKDQGQTFIVSAVVRNDDRVTRYASLYVGVANGSFLKGVGPVGVNPGSQVTLTVTTGEFLPPGKYLIDIVIAERTQADAPVRDILRDLASVDILTVGTLVVVGTPTIS